MNDSVNAVSGGAATGTELPRVQAGKPQRKSLVQKTEQPGLVQAWMQADIHPRSSGVVQQVLVDIGDAVTAASGIWHQDSCWRCCLHQTLRMNCGKNRHCSDRQKPKLARQRLQCSWQRRRSGLRKQKKRKRQLAGDGLKRRLHA
ncbi:MAG UNVERIFIED_CONTAM: hypothetical protein LVR18_17960 [Planctomycetaceae bacterium]